MQGPSTSPSPTRAPNYHKQDSRPLTRATKEQIALLMAMWAQNKPDSLCERVALAERTLRYSCKVKKLRLPREEEDKIIPDEDTGAALLDSNNMIMSVAGSGATHAAAYLCNRFPQQVSGGTICLSKRPCWFCTKLMIQRGVRRIIVPELAYDVPHCYRVLGKGAQRLMSLHLLFTGPTSSVWLEETVWCLSPQRVIISLAGR